MRSPLVAALALSLSLCIGVAAAVRADSLEPGSKAPDFSLVGSDGETYALSHFVGKRGVVLAWFPKAFTPG